MVHLLPNNTTFNETQQIMCFLHVKISRKIKTERKSVPNQSKPKSSWANPKLTHLNIPVWLWEVVGKRKGTGLQNTLEI